MHGGTFKRAGEALAKMDRWYMRYEKIDGIGVEIRDFGIPESLTSDIGHQIRELFQRWHLLLFRGRTMSPHEQLALCSIVGVPIDETLDGRRYSTFTNDGSSEAGTGPLPFHSDNSFSPTPVAAISLYALELPAKGTSTLFRDAERAWDQLGDRARRDLETRFALHMLDEQSSDRHRLPGYQRHATRDDPQTEHPIGLVNPNNGRRCIYVNEELTEYITGISRTESDELLEGLLNHIREASPIYEHFWQRDDLLIWDNLALQHARSDNTMANDGPGSSRTFRRVAITRPEWERDSDLWYKARAARRSARPLVRSVPPT